MSLKSPCSKICMMDPETGLCAGCHRTLEEIGRWSSYSEEERTEVWKKLEIRKSELKKEN
ncbi:DUF1289 domain-containing protein [Leptospira idonii]|uniref:DUF1289 domain-containing protein n=1 Tax=Leptospira idonii TaxID=1193500 RepID=A0A4V3JXS4_9LEPT|nr:DUF1289 domain-containing protein [Leptospira idonii]TGN17168.1 DUF1289 domain-containing protein [Leptospira idonii]